MKTKFNISITMFLTLSQIAPTHAMWARPALAALRSNGLYGSRPLASAMSSQPLESLQGLRISKPTLLARTLAAQHAESSSSGDSEQSNDEQNNQHRTLLGLGLLGGAALAAYTNDDLFESKVAYADTGEKLPTVTATCWLLAAAAAGTACCLWHAYKTTSDKNERKRIIEEIITMLLNSPATQTVQGFKTDQGFHEKMLRCIMPIKPDACLKLKTLIEKIISIESQEQHAGNYTFVHGYPWYLHFYQDIDAHLRSKVLDLPSSPLSLRFFKNPNNTKSTQYHAAREQLLNEGTPKEYFNNIPAVQKKVIFMNAALFANYLGGNTFQYLALNFAQNAPINGNLKKIFSKIDKEKFLHKYSRELKELEALHNNANQFGAAIVFSFSPKLLDKSVYMCEPMGHKARRTFNTGGEIESAQVMIDTLRTKPEIMNSFNQTEYVFIVTKDCGLNPHVQESGDLKIIPVNTADPTKYALYEHKRDELMAKIKADIDAERAAWSENEKRAHEATLEEMDNFFKKYNCLNDCGQTSRTQEA